MRHSQKRRRIEKAESVKAIALFAKVRGQAVEIESDHRLQGIVPEATLVAHTVRDREMAVDRVRNRRSESMASEDIRRRGAAPLPLGVNEARVESRFTRFATALSPAIDDH